MAFGIFFCLELGMTTKEVEIDLMKEGPEKKIGVKTISLVRDMKRKGHANEKDTTIEDNLGTRMTDPGTNLALLNVLLSVKENLTALPDMRLTIAPSKETDLTDPLALNLSINQKHHLPLNLKWMRQELLVDQVD